MGISGSAASIKTSSRQRDGIEVERTFADKASGKDTERPKLE
jgi:hypothetical protein